jgi:hypothetical protein
LIVHDHLIILKKMKSELHFCMRVPWCVRLNFPLIAFHYKVFFLVIFVFFRVICIDFFVAWLHPTVVYKSFCRLAIIWVREVGIGGFDYRLFGDGTWIISGGYRANPLVCAAIDWAMCSLLNLFILLNYNLWKSIY